MKRIIHVNANLIRQNLKNGTSFPVCRVEEPNKVRYCSEVEIKGPSRMIYSPNEPRVCGARLWIETEADVELVDETTFSEIRTGMKEAKNG
jgi:hypothetical protein